MIATQHDEETNREILKKELVQNVIIPVCGKYYEENETKIYVNGTGQFIIGGPVADAGCTGRKIIVDTYGGVGRHGGGAFSGKDPSKVDRSGAYFGRYVAKNIVAANLAEVCEIQISYCIGVAKPVSINLQTFGTEKIPLEQIKQILIKNLNFKPQNIINHLNLKRPIYQKTACYGHFGRLDPDFTWENTGISNRFRE